MKNVTRLLTVLAMLCIASASFGQITIGTGISVSQQPLNYWYGHGRHASIYTSAEMGTTGSGGTITTLSWYSDASSGQNTGPTIIRLKEVGATTTIASAAVYSTTITGATEVYNGIPATPVNGWNSIDITDFTVNTGQNLLVIVETDIANTTACGGIGSSTTNNWRNTSGVSGSAATWQYDDTGTYPSCVPAAIPTASQLSNRPNIILGGLAPPAPSCTTNTTPANAATGVTYTPSVAITWAAATFATSYDVYVATGCGGGVGAYSLVGNFVTTSGTIPSLSASTQYSWYVVPKNGTGSATGCDISNATCFTTAAAPPGNDDCGSPVVLTLQPFAATGCPASVSGTTVSATFSTNPPSVTFFTSQDDDVWYQFTATASSHIVRFCNVTYPVGAAVAMAIGINPGCTAGDAEVTALSTITITTGSGSGTITGLTPGVTYKMRVLTSGTTSRANFDISVLNPPDMAYVSSAITHPVTSAATAGSVLNQILRLNVITINSPNPLTVTQLDFSTAGTPGTSLPADITNARVYYTGATSTWTDGTASGTQFGSTIANPSGTMTFTGSQALSGGVSNTNNNFWLVYDLACGATGPNLDASMLTNGLTMTGGPYTPTTPDPPSNRTVTALASFGTAANGNWSNPATWLCGIPPNGTTTAININHNVNLDVNADVQSIVTVAPSKTFTIAANTFTVGGAGTGTQNLLINGTVTVSGGTLNVGTATGVTTSNITVASGATMTVSGSGIVNLGPTGGYNRTLSVTGTLTNSGTINVNGNVVFNTNSTFNMSGGNITIDGNGAASVATGTILLRFGSSSTGILLNGTGGTITIVDPHASNSTTNYAVGVSISSSNVPATSLAGTTFQFGDGVSTTAGNTSGFIFDTWLGSKNVPIGNVIVNGGSGATRFVSGTAAGSGDASDILGSLTVNSGSEIRTASAGGIGVYGNIINNGTISVTSGSSGVLFLGGSQGGSAPAATNPQTISGSGVWRNSTTSPTASINSLTMNNGGGTTLQVPLTVGSTLTLTNGKIYTDATNYIGVGTGLLPSGTIGTGTVSPPTTTNASHIVGPVRRALPATTWAISSQQGLFPIGDGTTARQLNIAPTTIPTAGSLVAKYVASDPGNPPATYTDGGISIDLTSPTGYWNVEYANGAAGGGYTVQANATGFTKRPSGAITAPDLPGIRLVKRTTGGNWVFGADGTAAAPSGLSAVSRTLCTTFSDFGIGGTSAALPLELASFTGKTESRSNMLLWETLTEKNVQWHIVERSVDGIKWVEVGRKAGQLDSQVSLKYELEDRAPLAKAYYRLRSVDVDGTENLSNSILLTRKGEHFGITAAFPSPTKDQVTVQFASLTEENVTIRVMDFTGRLVLEQQYAADNGINEVPVQLGSLQAGVYLVSISNATATAEPMRIVKE